MSYGQYRAVLATNRNQADRRAAFLAHYGTYADSRSTPTRRSTTASASATGSTRARAATRRRSTRALHGNNIPRSVVDNLIDDDARRRRAAAPLPPPAPPRARSSTSTIPYDFSIPLVDWDRRYSYDERARRRSSTSVAPLGPDYQARMWRGFRERWIDVYENDGKRSGAYSAPVYGVHPYMLLNWTDTLDDVFTLAHEMGHSMHTMLSHERQPFVYSDYTIFVAEVPSTLSEALLLEHLLARATDRDRAIVLLQHAIDNITSTFYTQVLFADFELAAHQLVEQDEPITADVLNALYQERFEAYYGDAVDIEAADADHLGAHPALLQLAVLRLPVRDLLRVGGQARARDHRRVRRPARPRPRAAVPRPARGRRQRPPDDAAQARRRRSRASRPPSSAVVDQLDRAGRPAGRTGLAGSDVGLTPRTASVGFSDSGHSDPGEMSPDSCLTADVFCN